MAKTINFGIDLGTTNSAIAKFQEGGVEVFHNPLGQKDTLPSVVAYRKGRIIVGDKAREYMERDPGNVVGVFKRKMGTSVRYRIDSTESYVSPVELSAQVLKELKNFIYTGEQAKAAVITIPASFDTVQSNATKKAGQEAGFEHVELLQEPIAASLAFVNRKESGDELEKAQWLVYDLGGGTFDVALLRIHDGEMRVIDHEGDNFLGGADFDAMIIDHLIIPHLEQEGSFTDLKNQFRSASGKYNKLWFALLNKSEDAKVMLSNHESADIEFEIEDDTGELLDIYFTITREDLEKLIEPAIRRTLDMIHQILGRNSMSASDMDFVLMVGGSTYIPYVRAEVGKDLGVEVNCSVDPRLAVAVGAAYFAGTRTLRQMDPAKTEEKPSEEAISRNLEVKMAYPKTSQENEEYFSARVSGTIDGLFYRILREDGGFDSGLKALEARIEEDLPLVPNSYNTFRFSVVDSEGNTLSLNLPTVGITQGKYSVTGQPLPGDICIEIDDVENSETRLEAIFRKNEILPLRRTFTRELTRSIRKGSEQEIIINVLEGPENALPSVNQAIGFITVKGSQLERDLIKGSDIEVTLEISESRDLRISAYLTMTDQEFSNLFTSSERHVHLGKLKTELEVLQGQAEANVKRLEEMEAYEEAMGAVGIQTEIAELLDQVKAMPEDDVTDLRFQLEDRKRRMALKLDQLNRDHEISEILSDYFGWKRNAREIIDEHGDEQEKSSFAEIVSGEKEMVRSASKARIRDAINRLWRLFHAVSWKRPDYLKWLFYNAEGQSYKFSNAQEGENLLKQGRSAIEGEEWDRLRVTINGLYNLLPDQPKGFMRGTGIG